MEYDFDLTQFIAIDIEHATRVKGTVCSIGIATFNNLGHVIDEYYTLVKPPNNEFEWFTTNKHKISSELTKEAPEFIDIFPEIRKRLNSQLVVAHGAFHTDKHCLEQAMELNGINDYLEIEWVCTQELCNCSLDIASKVINIDLDHHHALSDAIACGTIFAKYLAKELPLSEFEKLKKKSKKVKSEKIFPQNLKGEIFIPDFDSAKNQTNPFFMKKVVITGFSYAEKPIIAEELKKLGADIDSGVSKNTNFLVAGPTAGPSKLERMRTNIAEGRDARILSYDEFKLMKE